MHDVQVEPFKHVRQIVGHLAHIPRESKVPLGQPDRQVDPEKTSGGRQPVQLLLLPEQVEQGEEQLLQLLLERSWKVPLGHDVKH